MKTLLLEYTDVAEICSREGVGSIMDAMVDRLNEAIRSFHDTRVDVATREGFHYHQPYFGLLEWMPSCRHGDQTTIKVVGYHPHNPKQHHLPTILSTVYAFDAATGHLSALMDGTWLTAVRTAAASAIASRLLARPDARVLTLVGCGAQAVTQIHALDRLFPLEKIWGYDVDPSTADSLAARCGFTDTPIKPVTREELTDALEKSDILCTCTSEIPGAGPVLPPFTPRPHLHINAVGSDAPGKTELPLDLLHRARVFPDTLEQALREGECQQLEPAEIGPDLLTLVQQPDTAEAERDGLTVFDSTGWAFEDQVAMELMLEYARRWNLGREIDIEFHAADPKNPYDIRVVPPVEAHASHPAPQNGVVVDS